MKAICERSDVLQMLMLTKVYSFNKTKRKHAYSYISYERIICNNRDSPWINKDIRKKTYQQQKSCIHILLS